MITALLLSAVLLHPDPARVPGAVDLPDSGHRSVASPPPGPFAAPLLRHLAIGDTVPARPRAVEVSDAYELRLRIHRYASYTTVPLFLLQTVAGNQLFQAEKGGNTAPTWAHTTHSIGGAGLGALFAINTVTGVWNLWDSRHDDTGRGKRLVHAALMLASDAGFAYTGVVLAGRAEDSQQGREDHRRAAYLSMGTALAGYAVMLVGDH